MMVKLWSKINSKYSRKVLVENTVSAKLKKKLSLNILDANGIEFDFWHLMCFLQGLFK